MAKTETAQKKEKKKRAKPKTHLERFPEERGIMGPKGAWKYTEEFIETEAKEIIKWAENTDNFYLRDFAHERGYHPVRLSEFAEVSKTFSLALERAKDIQERKFMEISRKKEVDMNWVKYFAPRILQDRHYLKTSWDQQQNITQIQAPKVVINKISMDDDLGDSDGENE